MNTFVNGDVRLECRFDDGAGFHFVTFVRAGVDAGDWRPAARGPSVPVQGWAPARLTADGLAGEGPGFTWQTSIIPRAGGFWLETALTVDAPVDLPVALLLWLGPLDNLDDRQAHTWRQTVLRAPTVNAQGLGGNDLMAGYLYDDQSRLETIVYFPPEAFAWAPHRFYNFSVREALLYRPEGRYGFGLVPNAPEAPFHFPPGTHRLAWWFTQRPRQGTPSPWAAQRTLLEAVAPLLDPVPAPVNEPLPWEEMACRTLADLESESCWVTVQGVSGLRAYVQGSSAVGRDAAPGFELMTQLDVLWPLLLWRQATGDARADGVIRRLRATLPHFARPQWDYVANNYPPRASDSFMDTWYFLENALIKLPWVAYLTGDPALREMFFTALRGAEQLARRTGYVFPLFADAADWQARGSLLNASVGGLYAAGCVLAHQLSGGAEVYLDEAAHALRVMHSLPPAMLTHEPQQLSFAAVAASYLADAGYRPDTDWDGMVSDCLHLVLRMGYWGADPAAPYYDPRGMFQACASLCYPAYKENVETMIAWPEVLRGRRGPLALLSAFANLQRQHNYAFFDPWLPAEWRRGPCPAIPYEDLSTAEFDRMGRLGKEIYGAGEVFWSALLFGALGRVDDPEVLCLSLDVPCLRLGDFPAVHERRFLLYNPTPERRTCLLHSGSVARPVTVEARAISFVEAGS